MEDLLMGFSVALSFQNLLYCFVGVTLGTAVGVLPGIGPLATISMLLPITFYLEPTPAIIMMAGVYYGSEYGGSTASILLNLPGGASSAVTCLDGYPMSKQGRAGVALSITALASFIGGSLGILVLIGLSPLVVAIAFSFGAAEYFAAMVFALVTLSFMTSGSPLKALAMVSVGLLMGLVGTDVISGANRYMYGIPELYDGINVAAVTMGLFGVSEVIASIRNSATEGAKQSIPLRAMVPTRDDVKRSVGPTLRGFGVGSLIGPLPGLGATVASFLSYALEKRVAKDPSRFGKGAIEGVAGPESANNAAAQTAFIPILTMGIPSTASTAVMLSALMMQGINPGPRLMTEHADLFWGVIASFWIGNIMLLILNLPMIGLWVRLLRIPYRLLYPVIMVMICIGAYSVKFQLLDVWLVLAIGAMGYAMRLLDFEPTPLLIGFILGPMLEENFRRAMIAGFGDPMEIIMRPISGTLLALSVLFLLLTVWSVIRQSTAAKPPVLREE